MSIVTRNVTQYVTIDKYMLQDTKSHEYVLRDEEMV